MPSAVARARAKSPVMFLCASQLNLSVYLLRRLGQTSPVLRCALAELEEAGQRSANAATSVTRRDMERGVLMCGGTRIRVGKECQTYASTKHQLPTPRGPSCCCFRCRNCCHYHCCPRVVDSPPLPFLPDIVDAADSCRKAVRRSLRKSTVRSVPRGKSHATHARKDARACRVWYHLSNPFTLKGQVVLKSLFSTRIGTVPVQYMTIAKNSR